MLWFYGRTDIQYILLVPFWPTSCWRNGFRNWGCWDVWPVLWDQLLLSSMHHKSTLQILSKKYGNWPLNQVGFFISCFILLLHWIPIQSLIDVFYHFFSNSIYKLCGRISFSSFGLGFTLWTSIWTDKFAGLHGNLCINGLTYGNNVCINCVYGSFISMFNEWTNCILICSSIIFKIYYSDCEHKGRWNCNKANIWWNKSNSLSSDLVFCYSGSNRCHYTVELP